MPTSQLQIISSYIHDILLSLPVLDRDLHAELERFMHFLHPMIIKALAEHGIPEEVKWEELTTDWVRNWVEGVAPGIRTASSYYATLAYIRLLLDEELPDLIPKWKNLHRTMVSAVRTLAPPELVETTTSNDCP